MFLYTGSSAASKTPELAASDASIIASVRREEEENPRIDDGDNVEEDNLRLKAFWGLPTFQNAVLLLVVVVVVVVYFFPEEDAALPLWYLVVVVVVWALKVVNMMMMVLFCGFGGLA
tara:strand:- start:226 stop:576 length:351 start_codon:yes stop_codon:yes gene_type:complete